MIRAACDYAIIGTEMAPSGDLYGFFAGFCDQPASLLLPAIDPATLRQWTIARCRSHEATIRQVLVGTEPRGWAIDYPRLEGVPHEPPLV